MTTTRSFLKRAVLAAVTSALVIPAFASASPASAAKKKAPTAYASWARTFHAGGTSRVPGVGVANWGDTKVLVAVGAVATGTGAKAYLRTNFAFTPPTFGWSYKSDPATQKASNGGAGLETLQMYGSKDEVNAALATLELTTTSATTSVEIKVMATEYKEGLVYFPKAEHFYRFIQPKKADGALNDKFKWSEAKAAAEGSTELGLTGYLANITSAEENEYVTSRISPDGVSPAKNVWIGGAVADTNYEWKWSGGPEKDTIFYKGCEKSADTRTGSSPTGYHGFVGDEPNNWESRSIQCSTTTMTEACLLTNRHNSNNNTTYFGEWNDFPCDLTNATSEGYVVEYGNKAVGGDFVGVAIASSKLDRNVPLTQPTFLQTIAKEIGKIKNKVLSTITVKKKAKTVTKKKVETQAKFQLFNKGTYVIFPTTRYVRGTTIVTSGLVIRPGSTVNGQSINRNGRFTIKKNSLIITVKLNVYSGKKGATSPDLTLYRVTKDPVTKQERLEQQIIPSNWKTVVDVK